jgi:hypothetical protein
MLNSIKQEDGQDKHYVKRGEVIAKQEDEQDEHHTKWLWNKKTYNMIREQDKKKKSLAQHSTKIIKSYVQRNGRKRMKLKIDDHENNRPK